MDWDAEFDAWLDRAESTGGRLGELVTALLVKVQDLTSKPEEESATFKRVRQARRYELWRVAHPYDPDHAIRLIIWFPQPDRVVLCLLGFDKARYGDVWYDSASKQAEAKVDHWIRVQTKGVEE